ncbi:DsbA family protein [Pseudorhodobacter sp.]|uniref:DsbA family protein n=1 Tax=Pseudorhodobacter sp. TaxID=1934400 RepID=UPI0026489CE0|nr:DsbA family protein [Pseudorhodobacter sp.]MDN5788462.1 DsbA family protein [Pseudorhodobacter sp.]
MNRRDFTAAMAAALALSALPLWAQTAPDTSSATETATATLPDVPDMTLGNPDAKVVLTEYASYTCPHCAHFHDEVFVNLKRDYIDTGKIKFVFREVFFDRYGLWAAMLARCGGDMRYFGIQDILFSTQRDWAASDDPATVIDNLRRIGRTAGMDDAEMDKCLNDGAMAQAMVNKYQADTKADNIDSTPSLILDGKKYSNMNYADLKALLDAELAK